MGADVKIVILLVDLQLNSVPDRHLCRCRQRTRAAAPALLKLSGQCSFIILEQRIHSHSTSGQSLLTNRIKCTKCWQKWEGSITLWESTMKGEQEKEDRWLEWSLATVFFLLLQKLTTNYDRYADMLVDCGTAHATTQLANILDIPEIQQFVWGPDDWLFRWSTWQTTTFWTEIKPYSKII